MIVPVFVLMVAATVLGLAVYAGLVIREHRSADRRLRMMTQAAGPEVAIAAEVARWMPEHARLGSRLDEAVAADEVARRTHERHAEPVIRGKPLLAYTFFVLILSVLAMLGFLATRSLDAGLLETIGLQPVAAEIIGTMAAIGTVVVGVFMVEAAQPHALSFIEGSRWRVPTLLFAGLIFASTVMLMASVAPQRAMVRMGESVVAAEAACAELAADPAATSAERQMVCGEAQQLRARLQAASDWDSFIAVSAPLSELLGSIGLIRGLELLGVLFLARRSRKARNRRLAAQHKLAHGTDKLVSRIWQVMGSEGVSRDAIEEGLEHAGLVTAGRGPRRGEVPDGAASAHVGPTEAAGSLDHARLGPAETDEPPAMPTDEVDDDLDTADDARFDVF